MKIFLNLIYCYCCCIRWVFFFYQQFLQIVWNEICFFFFLFQNKKMLIFVLLLLDSCLYAPKNIPRLKKISVDLLLLLFSELNLFFFFRTMKCIYIFNKENIPVIISFLCLFLMICMHVCVAEPMSVSTPQMNLSLMRASTDNQRQ